MASLSRRNRLIIILASIWLLATVVLGGFYVYYPWKYLEDRNIDEYVRYPDFRTAQFLVLWIIPSFLYWSISIVTLIRTTKASTEQT